MSDLSKIANRLLKIPEVDFRKIDCVRVLTAKYEADILKDEWKRFPTHILRVVRDDINAVLASRGEGDD